MNDPTGGLPRGVRVGSALIGPVLATVVPAAGLFAATNVDDMVVLAVLNLSRRARGQSTAWQIRADQHAGVAALRWPGAEILATAGQASSTDMMANAKVHELAYSCRADGNSASSR